MLFQKLFRFQGQPSFQADDIVGVQVHVGIPATARKTIRAGMALENERFTLKQLAVKSEPVAL